MTNENLRRTLKLKAWEVPPPPPVPAPSASELCPLDRKPYAPMPPVIDPRWNIWTIGNLGEVERGLTTALLREVLARADGVRNVHIKKRGKDSRAKLVEEVHDARRTIERMGHMPPAWNASLSWWCWVWKEGGGLCGDEAVVPDEPAQQEEEKQGELDLALELDAELAKLGGPDISAAASPSTMDRNGKKRRRGSDADNTLLPAPRRQKKGVPAEAARQHAEVMADGCGKKRTRGTDADDFLLPAPRRQKKEVHADAARTGAKVEKKPPVSRITTPTRGRDAKRQAVPIWARRRGEVLAKADVVLTDPSDLSKEDRDLANDLDAKLQQLDEPDLSAPARQVRLRTRASIGFTVAMPTNPGCLWRHN
jgi:hypothetical protein